MILIQSVQKQELTWSAIAENSSRVIKSARLYAGRAFLKFCLVSMATRPSYKVRAIKRTRVVKIDSAGKIQFMT